MNTYVEEEVSMLLHNVPHFTYDDVEVVNTPMSISDEDEYAEDDENEDDTVVVANDDDAEAEDDAYLDEDGEPLETEDEFNSRMEYWNTKYNTTLKNSPLSHNLYKGMSETRIYFELK